MKRNSLLHGVDDEESNLNWRQSQRVCLNPSADKEEQEEDRRSSGDSIRNNCNNNNNTGALVESKTSNRTHSNRGSGTEIDNKQRMTTDTRQTAAIINNQSADYNTALAKHQQQRDPVSPHETSLSNEGVSTIQMARNLPEQQQQQRRHLSPLVVGSTTASGDNNNSNNDSGNKAKEGANSCVGSSGIDSSRSSRQQEGTSKNWQHGQRKQLATATKRRRERRQQFNDEKHPLDAASLISKLFFGWMFPFVYRGWRFGLERADLPKQSSAADSCHIIGDKLVANWNKELAASCNHHLNTAQCGHSNSDLYEKKKVHGSGGDCEGSCSGGKRPSLVRAILRTHAKWILFNSSITLFAEVVCKSLSAYSVGQMLELMSQRELGDYSRVWSLEEPLVCWTLTLVLSLVLWVISAQFYGFQMMRLGLHVRVGCSYLIYRKSLKLGQFESSQKTMGKMINLLTNDLDKFNYVFILLPFIWIGPIQCAISIYLLWPTLGLASLGSLIVISFTLTIHFYLGSIFSNYRRRIATITDERVRLLDETIGALKLIKLYAWEYPMRRAMDEVRQREMNLINRVGIIKATSTALMFVSSKLVLCVTLLIHCSVFGARLDTKTLFMSMGLLNNIQFTMCQMMPRALSYWVESLVSLHRIGNFLLSNEFEASNRLTISERGMEKQSAMPERNKLSSSSHYLQVANLFSMNNCSKVSIEYANVCARWPESSEKTLESISFRCQSPNLIAICGQLASGKSSLLLTLLNELPISEGKAHLTGSCSYASQKAWIFNGTLRDNIVFGSDFNDQRYQQVLDVCALRRDLDLLDCADLTYIQANSLSGGQQARVNLARCLYRQSDIYLLDDPFSALDGRVAEHIFEEAIKKFLANKLVLLATHNVKMLKQSDKVLLLDGGKQLAYCGFNELHRKLTSDKCFTDEQLQRLSFLVEGLSSGRPEVVATAVAADDDKELPANVLLAVKEQQVFSGDKMMDDCGCVETVDADDNIDKESDNQVLAGTSLNAAAAATATTSTFSAPDSAAQMMNVPDGELLRSILNKDKERSKDPASASRVCSEPESSFSGDDSLPSSGGGSTTEASLSEPVAYGCPTHQTLLREGNKSDLISATISGASDEQTASAHESHEEGGAILTNNKADSNSRSKVDSIPLPLLNNQQWTTTTTTAAATAALDSSAFPYRTSANNVEQCLLNDDSKSSVFESLERVATTTKEEQLKQVKMKEQATSGETDSSSNSNNKKIIGNSRSHRYGEKEVEISNAAIDGNRSRNGPADEETSIGGDSNKLTGLHVWYKYYTQTSLIRLTMIILTFLITQALFSTVDIYLTVWSLAEQNRALVSEITVYNQQQLVDSSSSSSSEGYLQKFDYGDGVAERMRTINGSLNMIKYDLMAAPTTVPTDVAPAFAATDGKLDPLLDWPLDEELGNSNTANNNVHNVYVVGNNNGGDEEIGKASISPLSSRSSREPPSLMSNIFVPPPPHRLVDLFYTSDVDSTITTKNSPQLPALHNSPADAISRKVNLKLSLKQSEQVLHQPADDAVAVNNNINNTISSTANNENLETSSSSTTTTTNMLVDQNIHKQSDEACNVKSIYRPFYLFAMNFTSGNQFQITYIILIVILFLSSTITNIVDYTSSTKSAIILYRKLIDNALFAKLHFFDINPSGRLLNRATRDIGLIDEALPSQAQQAYELLLRTAATFIMVAVTDFNLALPSLIILSIFLIYHSISVKPTKDIQRLEGILRSPILSHISTSLDGLHTIRSSKSENRFEQLFIKHQDENSSVFLLQIGCNRSTAIVLDCLSVSYTSIIALWAVVSGLSGPAAGLIVTSAMLLSGLTSHGILKLTETESLMTSVERVIEYCSLPQEENYDTSSREAIGNSRRGTLATGYSKRNSMSSEREQKWLSTSSGSHNITTITAKQQQVISKTTSGGGGGGSNWPTSGSVEYKNVDFYYNNKLEKPVLKNISFRLQSGEKVAIVGRTGAGKSSIIATLFKLYDFNGTILIDGVDIKNIDLINLRSAIGVIPQSPVLFSTTIRKNLDPFGVFDDFALWSALDKAHMRETVCALPGKLDYDIGSGGLSFSSGQKQLICLARVLLRQSRLIVMDEATANVDPNTDAIIQATIRREFKHCTVITIAHRLETILDYDRIMVLDAGRIVDFDSPERLASKKDGFLARSLNKETPT